MTGSSTDRVFPPRYANFFLVAGLVIASLSAVFPGGLGSSTTLAIAGGLLVLVLVGNRYLPTRPHRGRRLRPAGLLLTVAAGMSGPATSAVVVEVIRRLELPADPLLAPFGAMLMAIGAAFHLVNLFSDRLLQPLPDECGVCSYPIPRDGGPCPECGAVPAGDSATIDRRNATSDRS